MPSKRGKRQASSPLADITASPTAPPVLDINMETKLAAIDSRLEFICGKLEQMNVLDAKLTNLQQENTALRQEVSSLRVEIEKKDERISTLTDQVNRMDQAARSTSVRIFGLDVTTTTSSTDLRTAVFNNIIQPILETAKENGDVPSTAHPHPHLLIDNVFVLPTKKNTPPPVILKLSSQYIRNLIFIHKKAALPKTLDLNTNKQRNRFSIYEDLSPSNYAIFRAFSDDPRVRSVWSYSGQVRFKVHDSETVYKVKSAQDSFDSLVKPSRSPPRGNR
jgi:cell division septum initiation protein DivIVA